MQFKSREIMAGRVLIANNSANGRIMLKVNLSAASYAVQQAMTGTELLEAAAENRPELIILDSAFDDDRAIDLCIELKSRDVTSEIPVLILASGYSAADRLAALAAGADDVLTSPISKTWLLACVRNVLRKSAIEQELRLRNKTAMELGFDEAKTPYYRQGNVLVARNENQATPEWEEPLRSLCSCTVSWRTRDSILKALDGPGPGPDLIVLPVMAAQRGEAPENLLAELRSRSASRHAAIVMFAPAAAQDAAVAALDMGANEVISESMPAAEIAFRLSRQLRRKLDADHLRHMMQDSMRMAVTDTLTGLFNRRYALPHLKRVAQESARNGSPFAVMVLDLDRFKKINDTFGHAAGDTVLREIARRLKSNIRSADLIARIGGEEFLVILPDTDLATARVAAERLRKVTCSTPIDIGDGHAPIHVTASIGVSVGGNDGAGSTQVERMVDRADQALLGAKSTGRNQVIIERTAA